MTTIRIFLYKKKHRSGNVTWVVRWKHPVTGQWFNVPGGKTKAEAELIRAKLWKDLYNGKDPTRETPAFQKLTVEELAKLFFSSPRFITFSPHWQKVRRAQIEKVIVPALGNQIFLTLRRDPVIRLYLSLKENGLSHSTIRKYHLALGILGRHFEELNPGEASPVRRFGDFSKIFPRQAPTRVIGFLTPEELRAIYNELRKNRSQAYLSIVQFLASTGLRRSEALTLTWNDIDFASGFVVVRKSKTGRARRVPLEKDAIEALSMMPRTNTRVFVNSKGQPYHADSIIKPLKRAAERAGIMKRVDIHMLRHSYGSNKIRAGWGLKKVSMILGHSDITITAEVYTHLLDGDLKVRDEALLASEPPKSAESASDFDNVGLSDNSKKQLATLPLVDAVQRIAHELSVLRASDLDDTALQGLIRETVQKQISRNSKAVDLQAEAVDCSHVAVKREPAENVPHVFRETSKSGLTEMESQRKNPETFVIPGLYSEIKMAIPTGVEPVTFSSGG